MKPVFVIDVNKCVGCRACDTCQHAILIEPAHLACRVLEHHIAQCNLSIGSEGCLPIPTHR